MPTDKKGTGCALKVATALLSSDFVNASLFLFEGFVSLGWGCFGLGLSKPLPFCGQEEMQKYLCLARDVRQNS
jgi:hypothetical protein